MDPEQENVDVEVEVDTTEETSPVQEFADSVAEKAKMVEAGDLSVADFVSECMEALGAMEVAPEAPSLGGLGAGNGAFPNLEDLESE